MGETVPFERPRRPTRGAGKKRTPAIDRRRALRLARAGGAYGLALTVLWLALASPLSRQTEMSDMIPFGLLPIALLLGIGGIAQEYADIGTPARRDGLLGLSSAVATFAFLRLAGVF